MTVAVATLELCLQHRRCFWTTTDLAVFQSHWSDPTLYVLERWWERWNLKQKYYLITNSNFWQNTGEQKHTLYSLQPTIAHNEYLFHNSGNIQASYSSNEWVWKLKPIHVTGSLPREQSCLAWERSREWEQKPGVVVVWTLLSCCCCGCCWWWWWWWYVCRKPTLMLNAIRSQRIQM